MWNITLLYLLVYCIDILLGTVVSIYSLRTFHVVMFSFIQVQNHEVEEGSSGKKPDPCSHSGSKQQAPLICLSDI